MFTDFWASNQYEAKSSLLTFEATVYATDFWNHFIITTLDTDFWNQLKSTILDFETHSSMRPGGFKSGIQTYEAPL